MNKLYVVGIGPGAHEAMTIQADQALAACDIIVGYTTYVELVKPAYPDKEYRHTGMTKEVDRCRMALEIVREGHDVALVCSGDSGIYGMAGLCWELKPEFPEAEIVVIPGVTAALSGGAVLGAPLGHDTVILSLSDRLTPWELIETRLECAAKGDFCMSIYNPSSKGRSDYLQKACDILLRTLKPETVCGYVRNIGREGEEGHVLTLGELRDTPVDMFTTVFIGNSNTKVIEGKMVTPRGYRNV